MWVLHFNDVDNNENESNFIIGETADRCCFLVNHKEASASLAGEFLPKFSFSLTDRDPYLTLVCHWALQKCLQNSI